MGIGKKRFMVFKLRMLIIILVIDITILVLLILLFILISNYIMIKIVICKNVVTLNNT